MVEHPFTSVIIEILTDDFDSDAQKIFSTSELLQYINIKSVAANRGSKSRPSFGNLYAIYALIEDYIQKDFHKNNNYGEYSGANFTNLLKRMRELPFGSKLQNHILNHRLNEDYKKYFPTTDVLPVIRDTKSKKYWVNESLLKISIGQNEHNIASSIVKIIDAYVEAKKKMFDEFIKLCENLKLIKNLESDDISNFILEQLAPNVDARVFEIVSYSILKFFYHDITIFIGESKATITEKNLTLYKTGRTNANDGGIDFVMKPLGRFFQVTETLDFKKYFLDIDKVEKFPITFVIKSNDEITEISEKIRSKAKAQYGIEAIVEKYMD
ncbi:MAG: hypothetical protein K8F28_01105, partial [Ignavibacteriaceae bacterium]|nr:hypothetical protein [Ignavibacteriaceae bacterium]